MIALEKLIQDLFDDPKLSNTNLRSFSDDHLVRLSLNNPGGVYSPLITDTAARYTGYFGSMTDLAVKEAIRQNLTITTIQVRVAVIERIRTVNGLVVYRFGAGSATYESFYPHGLSEYTEARLDDLTVLLSRFASAAGTHLTATDPAEVTAINADILAFNNARTAQHTVFAEEDMLRTGRNVTRKELTRQLTRNLLIIAADMIDDADRFNDYFDSTYLPRSSSSSTTDGTFEGTVEAGATVNITKDIAPDAQLKVTNTGAAKLTFCLAAADTDVCLAGANLLPGESRTVTAADLGPGTGTHLNVTNADLVQGAYTVEVIS
jgi:hypothetical protein